MSPLPLPSPDAAPAAESAAAPEHGPCGVEPPLTIALMGPTASGKTALAIALAEALDLAVLSVDSRQLYRGMDVGTAKPSAAQRARVRHELLDLRDPDQPINLQEFVLQARRAIAAEHRRRGVALLVGGSGLYLEALLRGLAPPAVPPQPGLRAQLAALGQPLCHGLLVQADPEAAGRIATADAVRTQRALEVIYATGRPLSGQRGHRPPPWRILELGLDPGDLAARINRRTRAMYDEGLVEETEALLRRFGADCPLLRTMGYDEARRLLAGELDREAAIALTALRTRRYAKRQRTWFRGHHRPLWLSGPQSAAAEALRLSRGTGPEPLPAGRPSAADPPAQAPAPGTAARSTPMPPGGFAPGRRPEPAATALMPLSDGMPGEAHASAGSTPGMPDTASRRWQATEAAGSARAVASADSRTGGDGGEVLRKILQVAHRVLG